MQNNAKPSAFAIEGADWPGVARRPSLLNPLGLPSPLTGKQRFYIGFTQCIGAACVSGAANFAVACAMYRTTDKEILIWPLEHNTVAGDCAVTTFIQGAITFVLVSALVHNDLRLHRIDPFPIPWPHQKIGTLPLLEESNAKTFVGRMIRRFHNIHGLSRGLHFFSGSEAQDLLNFKVPLKQLAKRWLLGVWKGTVLSALFWFIWWPITIAIIAPLYGGRNLTHTWIPEVIKFIYGFTLALVQNPIVACIALGSEDACREHLREEQFERWKAMSSNTTTADEKPRQSFQLESAAASVRQSLDFGMLKQEKRNSRTSLDLADSRNSREGSRRSSVEFVRISRSNSDRRVVSGPPTPTEIHNAPSRRSLDSARDHLAELRQPKVFRRRSDQVVPRRLSVVKQESEREIDSTQYLTIREIPQRRTSIH